MQHVQETNLACSLIEVARPELNARERNHVFISVGTAIRILLKLIAIKRIPVSPRLVGECTGWLEAYVLHEDHERLQAIIGGLTVTGTGLRPRAVVRSLSCARRSASSAIAADPYRDRGVAARAG